MDYMFCCIFILIFSIIYSGLEKLIDPLKQVCMSKVKSNAVKQEYEKQDELKRSAMRAFLALLAIPDAGMYHPLFAYFLIISTNQM